MNFFVFNYLQTTSLANVGSQADLLSIAVGVSRSLNLLAERANSHVLPAPDFLHFNIELAGRAGSTHVTRDVLVDRSWLLEETNIVMVRTNTVMRKLQGSGNPVVGVHDEAGLYLRVVSV